MREKKKKILLVEDYPNLKILKKEILEKANYEVVTAETVDEALTAFSANSFDLVITDLLLTDGRGDELCHQIRRLNHSVPLVLHSGWLTEDYKEAAERESIKLLPKALHPREFLQSVAKYLQG